MVRSRWRTHRHGHTHTHTHTSDHTRPRQPATQSGWHSDQGTRRLRCNRGGDEGHIARTMTKTGTPVCASATAVALLLVTTERLLGLSTRAWELATSAKRVMKTAVRILTTHVGTRNGG